MPNTYIWHKSQIYWKISRLLYIPSLSNFVHSSISKTPERGEIEMKSTFKVKTCACFQKVKTSERATTADRSLALAWSFNANTNWESPESFDDVVVDRLELNYMKNGVLYTYKRNYNFQFAVERTKFQAFCLLWIRFVLFLRS